MLSLVANGSTIITLRRAMSSLSICLTARRRLPDAASPAQSDIGRSTLGPAPSFSEQQRHADPISGEASKLLGLDIGAARDGSFLVGREEEVIVEQRRVLSSGSSGVEHLDEVRRSHGGQKRRSRALSNNSTWYQYLLSAKSPRVVPRRDRAAVGVGILAGRGLPWVRPCQWHPSSPTSRETALPTRC